MGPATDPYRQIVEHFPGVIVFVYEGSDELRYTFVGGEGLADIGLTPDDLEGHVVAEGRPPEIRERIHAEYRKALDGQEVTFEIEAEGRHFRFELAPASDGTEPADTGIGIVQDITEQVVYRTELERQNERLERFTQLVFHDIRNPLNVAQERLALLDEECDREHVEPIRTALDRIESLTDEDTALIDERDVETLDAVELDAVAMAAWRNVATRSAEIRVETEQVVRADGGDLRRLFENLFRNAVEHGSTSNRPSADDAVEHGGEDVTVTVGALETETGFYVADDGSGMSPEERDTAFERGVSHAEEGTGLGLFIVESVAEGHGWTVGVTESEDGGARFEITGVETVSR